MTELEIIKLAKSVREAQKAFFQNRCKENLERSKKLERQLDAALEEYLTPTLPIF